MDQYNSENNNKITDRENSEGQSRTFLNREITTKRMNNRILLDKIGKKIFSLSVLFALLILGILFYRIGSQSIGWLDLQFLTSNLSIFPDKAGIYGVIIGSFLLMVVVIPVTLLLGI